MNVEIGRIILIATSPDRNVRLTQDEGFALAMEVLRLQAALHEIAENDPYRQSAAGIRAHAAIQNKTPA